MFAFPGVSQGKRRVYPFVRTVSKGLGKHFSDWPSLPRNRPLPETARYEAIAGRLIVVERAVLGTPPPPRPMCSTHGDHEGIGVILGILESSTRGCQGPAARNSLALVDCRFGGRYTGQSAGKMRLFAMFRGRWPAIFRGVSSRRGAGMHRGHCFSQPTITLPGRRCAHCRPQSRLISAAVFDGRAAVLPGIGERIRLLQSGFGERIRRLQPGIGERIRRLQFGRLGFCSRAGFVW